MSPHVPRQSCADQRIEGKISSRIFPEATVQLELQVAMTPESRTVFGLSAMTISLYFITQGDAVAWSYQGRADSR